MRNSNRLWAQVEVLVLSGLAIGATCRGQYIQTKDPNAVGGAPTLTEVDTIPRISASGVLGLSKLKCPLGVCTLYDDTAVTGVTQWNLKAGAGQATLPTPLLNIWLDVAGTVPGLRVLANGNVGIGTTGPLGSLDVSKSATGLGGEINITNPNSVAVGQSVRLGFRNFGLGATGYYSARIDSIQNATGSGASDLVFSTYSGSLAPGEEKMRVTSGGNVGIGTSGPTSRIHGTTTLSTATGNEVAYSLDYTTNKATSGNDTGLQINMTATATPGTSKPLQVNVGGAEKFSVDKTGALVGQKYLGSGTAVTITSGFGTTPSIVGVDTAFRVTLGNPVGSSGVVALKQTWTNAPVVVCNNETTNSGVRATPTTSQVTLTQSSGAWVAGDAISCLALGY